MRDYELIVNDVVVRPPMRIVFDGFQSVKGELNKLNISIYNLNRDHRNALLKAKDEKKNIPVRLKVGYEDRLLLIFEGQVLVGTAHKDDADLVSSLECLDGGFDYLYSFTNTVVKPGANIIDTILVDMPNTGKGKIGEQPVLTRPKVLIGNSHKLIQETISEDEDFYIDDGQLYITKENEVVSAYIPVVKASTGLMTTPDLSGNEVKFTTKMNPSLKIGRRCTTESVFAPNTNGIYKIETINYKGDFTGTAWDQTCFGKIAKDYKLA